MTGGGVDDQRPQPLDLRSHGRLPPHRPGSSCTLADPAAGRPRSSTSACPASRSSGSTSRLAARHTRRRRRGSTGDGGWREFVLGVTPDDPADLSDPTSSPRYAAGDEHHATRVATRGHRPRQRPPVTGQGRRQPTPTRSARTARRARTPWRRLVMPTWISSPPAKPRSRNDLSRLAGESGEQAVSGVSVGTRRGDCGGAAAGERRGDAVDLLGMPVVQEGSEARPAHGHVELPADGRVQVSMAMRRCPWTPALTARYCEHEGADISGRR